MSEDVYVMAECHPWHKQLLDAGDRTTLRQSFWSSVIKRMGFRSRLDLPSNWVQIIKSPQWGASI